LNTELIDDSDGWDWDEEDLINWSSHELEIWNDTTKNFMKNKESSGESPTDDWSPEYDASSEDSIEDKSIKYNNSNTSWRLQIFTYYLKKGEDIPAFIQLLDDGWENLWNYVKNRNLEITRITELFNQNTLDIAIDKFITYENSTYKRFVNNIPQFLEEHWEKMFRTNKNLYNRYDICYSDRSNTSCKYCKKDISYLSKNSHALINGSLCPNTLLDIFEQKFGKDVVFLILEFCGKTNNNKLIYKK
jgi:hypothetical protein